MNKKTLTSLFAESIYQIPDYQRGYAWEEKQWKDFIQDIDALVDEQVTSHYTGTVVVYEGRDAEKRPYGRKKLKVLDVVDGQQRLTTTCLYLSVIIRALIQHGESDYERDIDDFLYAGATCKLNLNNETGDIFYDLLKTGYVNTPLQSPHQHRLVEAHRRFQHHISEQLQQRGGAGVAYLKELHYAITQKLNFTFYVIESEAEIGMTFELMNSRGKDLSVLELLKNYLMHWVSRNENNLADRETLTKLINRSWKDTYTNLGASSGNNEDQCLRIAWTLYCSHSPANWHGYEGFKADEYIPLRTFSKRTKAETKIFIEHFVMGLAEVSHHYASIINPTTTTALFEAERIWLSKIRHTGNIANFLPLMVAARKQYQAGQISEGAYIDMLKALECYAYRVFLWAARRSNAGKSSFYRWGYEIFTQPQLISDITRGIHQLTRYYAPEDDFINGNANPSDWYRTRNRLRYTLFEYELHLLATEGKNSEPRLGWDQLSDSTIEHILPQNPAKHSHWNGVWNKTAFNASVHDIANLVLTHNNASYSNFEFARKKGQPGLSPSYSDSDIRQERKLAAFADWTPKEFAERRNELIIWINQRWKTVGEPDNATLEVNDEADDDGIEHQEG
ncbi:MAG TPA: DUF262 domain-containing protein [Herpetosiphon sp.]|uniref:DUF262 domain-containing protein n=1 Tax=Herpetosiphon aurantiacus (strain ATCC 23779 / DSM 785 / 114-95) TaxID=316274 RepID=A9AVQ7_HERA2|nr:DUF262 domain-containing protein [Herpetosiphon sp.]ABX06657.1 protein of unknown function DUF262 [Herpetosiphon aurantiacus DSM 785]HBW49323.1 DUF262 domain-containing protein [Herpetosiphon sp.]